MIYYRSVLEKKPFHPVSFADGTIEQLKEMLDAHYAGKINIHDYWNVGDSRDIRLSSMSAQYVAESYNYEDYPGEYNRGMNTIVLTNAGGKYLTDRTTECAFQFDIKYVLNNGYTTSQSANWKTTAASPNNGYINNSTSTVGGWKECARRKWCNDTLLGGLGTFSTLLKKHINSTGVGNGIDAVEETEDWLALRSMVEIMGTNTFSASGEGSQVEYYRDSANRKGYAWNYNAEYWLRSPTVYNGRNNLWCVITTSPSANAKTPNTNDGIKFFGCI